MLEEILFKFRWTILFFLLGLILVSLGVIYYLNNDDGFASTKIEVLESTTSPQDLSSKLIVEISGAIEHPGVYKLPLNSRIEDLLIASGGISSTADRELIDKNVNRAAKLVDGQKVYIPDKSQNLNPKSQNNFSINSEIGLMNINLASQKQLESLSGIGPVYAQNIIEQRPYSSIDELVSKKVLSKNVFEKIKGKISVY